MAYVQIGDEVQQPKAIDVAQRFCEGITHLRHSWIIFCELSDGYGTFRNPSKPPTQIEDILFSTCPNLFSAVRNALMINVLLGISRMTDPAEMGKHEQLSFERVIADLPDGASVKDTLNQMYDQIKPNLDELREPRHKQIAHADLMVSLDLEAPTVTKRSVLQPVVESLHTATFLLGEFYGRDWAHDESEVKAEAEALRRVLRNAVK